MSAALVGTRDRLIPIDEVCRQAGFGETKIREWIAAGTFPRAVAFGAARRWSENEVQHWIEAKKQTRDASVDDGGPIAVGDGGRRPVPALPRVRIEKEW